MFITLEGPEGGGKTTQARLLTQYLTQRVNGQREVICVREPGGTPIGDQIRAILHDHKNEAMIARAELLLYSASRAQLVAEVLRPCLERGGLVICDRFADSTLAYQGYGRGLDLEALRQITAFATGGLKPDLTLFLDIEPSKGLARRAGSGEEWNRMDALALEFHHRVKDGYLQLIAQEPGRWITINADGPTQDVHREICAAVDARL